MQPLRQWLHPTSEISPNREDVLLLETTGDKLQLLILGSVYLLPHYQSWGSSQIFHSVSLPKHSHSLLVWNVFPVQSSICRPELFWCWFLCYSCSLQFLSNSYPSWPWNASCYHKWGGSFQIFCFRSSLWPTLHFLKSASLWLYGHYCSLFRLRLWWWKNHLKICPTGVAGIFPSNYTFPLLLLFSY